MQLPQIRDVTFVRMTPEEEQAKAAKKGSFPYLQISKITAEGKRVSISVDHRTAHPSTANAVSCCGFITYEFEKSAGTWTLVRSVGGEL